MRDCSRMSVDAERTGEPVTPRARVVRTGTSRVSSEVRQPAASPAQHVEAQGVVILGEPIKLEPEHVGAIGDRLWRADGAEM